MWASLVGESKLRLQVGELPISTGGSSAFRQKVADEIAAFKTRWEVGWRPGGTGIAPPFRT